MNSNQKHSENLSNILAYAATIKRLSALRHHPDYAILLESTTYLPSTATIGQRLWHAANGAAAPKCKQCGSPVSWRKDLQSYSVFCGSKCAHSDPDVAKKTADTVLSKYGVDHVSMAGTSKNKRISTNLD